MAITSFNREFKLQNANEAESFADRFASDTSATPEKNFRSCLKQEKDLRDTLRRTLKEDLS